MAGPLHADPQERRTEAMRQMYHHPSDPKSLDEVGQAFGLCRERVRQIFDAAGIPRRRRHETRHMKYVVRQRRVVE